MFLPAWSGAVFGKVPIPPGLAMGLEPIDGLRPGSWTCFPVEPMKRRSCHVGDDMLSCLIWFGAKRQLGEALS